jgi:hypothetical protein
MNKFCERFWIPACAGMTGGLSGSNRVIPAQAGIHSDAGKKSKEFIDTSDFANFHMVSCEIHYE